MSIKQSLHSLYSHKYNKRHPIRALFRWGNWHVRKRISSEPWVWSLWGDRRAWFWPDSNQSMYLAYNWFMDWKEFSFIKKYINPSDTVIDVGANIGVYVLWITRFLGKNGRLIAFEPDRRNYKRLRMQVTLNELSNVKVEDKALAGKKGVVEFSQNKDEENHILTGNIDNNRKEKTTTVETDTLDEYISSRRIGNIDYLKLDVEGYEKYLLEGAHDVLSKNKVGVIQFEVNNQVEKHGISKDDVINTLKTLNYETFDYGNKEIIENTSLDENSNINIFATHDIDYVKERLK